ncbi:unnamed protein product [Fusarium graminearum]|uniref:Uncharacterized protein n=1 Tax=Gibberella zeae TaxID=5518 RepID=A0A4E9DVH6_GIBZA|nr:unnamed protein product [Fusarium graminearum]CAF3601034.1 unnamed protein product [Fusarium graminearum]CAG1979003.1 unnamed protein product [Fusarium graminearum]CAG1990192.1 unnamed protein product [Fusarium graminearum]
MSPVLNGPTHLNVRRTLHEPLYDVAQVRFFASSCNKRDAVVLEEQEQGASQVLRRSVVEINRREAKQFARRGQGKRDGWTAWTLRPVGVLML